MVLLEAFAKRRVVTRHRECIARLLESMNPRTLPNLGPCAVRGAALALALVAVSAAPAHAQTSAPAPTEAQRAEARAHFHRATSFLRSNRWLDAIPELEAARALAVTPSVLFNLGLAQRAVGRLRASRENFRAFLQATPGVSPGTRAQVLDYLIELSASLGHLELHPTPDHVTVMLDGQPAPPPLADLEVDPGTHVVTVSASGFVSATRTVQVGIGQRVVLELQLVAEPARETPVAPVPVPVPTPALPPAPPSEPARNHRNLSVGPWVLVGAGVASLGAAAGVYLGLRQSALDEVASRCDATGCALEALAPLDLARTYTVVAGVALGVGVAAVAGGVVWYLLARPHGESAAPRVARWGVAPTVGGMLVSLQGAL